MATTKILQSDLDLDLQTTLTDLENAKGTKDSLTKRLDDVDVSLSGLGNDVSGINDSITSMQGDISTVNENITTIQGDVSTNASDISTLQTNVSNLQKASSGTASSTDVNALKTQMKELAEYGNFSQSFTYDANGNVTQEKATGDVAYTTTYVYTDAVAGTLNYSTKVYTDENGKTVTIKKVYAYDAATGNITGIAVTTTVA